MGKIRRTRDQISADQTLIAAMKRIMRHLKSENGQDTDSSIKAWAGMNDELYDRAVKRLIRERKVVRPVGGYKIGTLMTKAGAKRAASKLTSQLKKLSEQN